MPRVRIFLWNSIAETALLDNEDSGKCYNFGYYKGYPPTAIAFVNQIECDNTDQESTYRSEQLASLYNVGVDLYILLSNIHRIIVSFLFHFTIELEFLFSDRQYSVASLYSLDFLSFIQNKASLSASIY